MPKSSMFDLKGKRALITGSSRGLGFAMAKGLAEAGAEILINGRDTHLLGEAAKSLSEQGANVKAIAFDVTSPDSIADAIEHIVENIGPIDILINNVGVIIRKPLLDFPAEKFERMMSINVDAMFYVCKAVGPHMIARGSGKIINISSGSGILARAGNIPYGVSKAAVNSLTRGMAAEWAPHGLNVNAIAPGMMAAGMNEDILNDAKSNAFVSASVPAGKWGKPEDIVGAAVFLSSDAASYVNGHILVVDGGLTATL